jgi:arylsulfatase A-like enzyme
VPPSPNAPRTRTRIWRVVRSVLLAAPLHGALLATWLFYREVKAATDLAVMGWRDDSAAKYALGTFGGYIVHEQLKLLLLYLTIGAALGLLASVLGRMWDFGRGVTPKTWRRVLRSLGGIVVLHGYFLARGIIQYPQLYAEWLFDKGGLGASVQVALTHHVSLALLDLLFFALLAALLVVPLVRRARAAGMLGSLAEVAARLRPRLRDRRVWIAAAVLVVGFTAVGVVAALPTRAPAKGPNVLLISLDSLRGDRVGGPAERVTPTISDLARRGTHFRHEFVTLPRTFPSWVTLLTGRYPHRHGVRTMFPDWEDRQRVTGLFPKALQKAGYRTAAVSDFAGEIFTRMDFGFDTVEAPTFRFRDILAQRGVQIHQQMMPYVATRRGHKLIPAVGGLAENSDPEMLTDSAIEELRRVSRHDRFFLTVFYSASHFPYASRDPYYRKFVDPKYRGPFLYQKPASTADRNLTEADTRQIHSLFDGAVYATDQAVARLLRELRRLGLEGNTIIIVTGDHGENMWEEGRGMGHGEHLRGDKVLHVPLVIYDPIHKPTPRAVDAITRDVDLVPTLAAILGLPAPAEADGVDLGPLVRGEKTDLGLRAYSETGMWMLPFGPGYGPGERIPYPPVTQTSEIDRVHDDDIVVKKEFRDLIGLAKHRAIRTPEWKLVYMPLRDGVRYQLFDLKHDPEQKVDVADKHPEVLKELRENLLAWMLAQPGTVLRRDFVIPEQ